MLTGGDFNLNSLQRSTDSLKEVLKQTMLNHEAIFRKQVHELHRLYMIQKTLMEDLSCKEFERYASWTANTQATSITFQDPPKYKLLTEEKTFSSLSTEGSTRAANWGLLEVCNGAYSMLQQRPLSVQLPSNEYIHHADMELPKERSLFVSHSESMEVKNFLRSDQVWDPEEVKLSLNTAEDTSRKGGAGRSWHKKETSFSAQDVIDLEKSPEPVLDEETKSVSSLHVEAPTNYVGNKHVVQIPVLFNPSSSGRTRQDPAHVLFTNHSRIGHKESFEKARPFSLNTGLDEYHSNNPFISLLTRKQKSTSHEAHVDLNNPGTTYRSHAASSSCFSQGFADKTQKGTHTIGTCWRQPNGCLNETSGILQQDNAAYSSLRDFGDKDSSTQACARITKLEASSGSEMCPIDLESMPEAPLELFKEFSCRIIKPKEGTVDLSLRLPNVSMRDDNQMGTSAVTPFSKVVSDNFYTSFGVADFPQIAGNAEVQQVKCEKSEEETVSSSACPSLVVQTGHCKESPTTSKSDCYTSNSIKDMQSGIEDKHKVGDLNLSAFEESGITHLGSQVEETQSGEQDPDVETVLYACIQKRSLDCSKSKYHSKQQEEAMEMDILVQKAAESLIRFSLENSACSQDWLAKAGSNELADEDMNEQPQYSSDSFESITLRLTESNLDDYSVSSMPVEVNEAEKSGTGLKLRRGKRLKDFQKDILPGLVSLSRHEICEDINIIGGVTKTKESRKSRCRKISGEDWCVPVRRRPARLNYAGRRNYC